MKLQQKNQVRRFFTHYISHIESGTVDNFFEVYVSFSEANLLLSPLTISIKRIENNEFDLVIAL
jgi:hypothetical protein